MDHLVGDVFGDRGKIKVAVLRAHLGVVDHLEEEIAQFPFEVVHVSLFDGIGDFIGFFNGVGHDRGIGLFNIPRATCFGITQAGHDFKKAGQTAVWIET